MSDTRAVAPAHDADLGRGHGQQPVTAADGTTSDPDNLVRRALQVIPVLVFVGTCLAIVKYASRPITNTDTYFHLRFGQRVPQRLEPARPGPVTPFATREWLPTQWAPQMLMAWMEDRFGLAGVAWLAGDVVPPVRPGALRRRAAAGLRAGWPPRSRCWPSPRHSLRCRPARRC